MESFLDPNLAGHPLCSVYSCQETCTVHTIASRNCSLQPVLRVHLWRQLTERNMQSRASRQLNTLKDLASRLGLAVSDVESPEFSASFSN